MAQAGGTRMTAPIDISLRWQVIEGDCLAVLPTLPAGCVDAVVTDPPYGIGFMNKGWDKPTPESWGYFAGSGKRPSLTESQAFQATAYEWFVACLRVAKPGAHLLAFGGTRTFHRLTCAIEDAGWEVRDCLSWLYGSGFPKSHNGAWGGTALKPAWEPVVLARKPLIGTVAANHDAHGTGALNIDGCRIAGTKPVIRAIESEQRVHSTLHTRSGKGTGEMTTEGRWPANVVLDEEAASRLDAETGTLQSGEPMVVKAGGKANAFGHFDGGIPVTGYGDSGGASRFFYCAKPSRSEREAGLGGFEEKKVHGPSGDGRCWDIPGSKSMPRSNNHPTVKPVSLMRWLCRLVTPKGGLVLDPFLGSGTTGIACHHEGTRFLGIEREAAYVAIARARIAAEAAQGTLALGGT